MVLIFSIYNDYSTNCVVQWLNHWGVKVIRINRNEDTYRFLQITEDGIYFENSFTGETFNLKKAKACWWRRSALTRKKLSVQLKEHLVVNNLDLTDFLRETNGFYSDETTDLINYINYSIYSATPINLGKPNSDLNRLVTIDVAKKNGFKVPKHRVLKNWQQLKDCNKSYGKMVTKSINNGIYNQIENRQYYTYTEQFRPEEIEQNQNVNFFPSLVMELVEKKYEIRTFYMEGEFYSMAIFSQSEEQTKVDFRKYATNRTVPYQLPENIEKRLENIFKEFNMNTGSADIIVDTNDEYVFLEINSVGQFDMTSRPCNYNLHKKVANYLRNGSRVN